MCCLGGRLLIGDAEPFVLARVASSSRGGGGEVLTPTSCLVSQLLCCAWLVLVWYGRVECRGSMVSVIDF